MKKHTVAPVLCDSITPGIEGDEVAGVVVSPTGVLHLVAAFTPPNTHTSAWLLRPGESKQTLAVRQPVEVDGPGGTGKLRVLYRGTKQGPVFEVEQLEGGDVVVLPNIVFLELHRRWGKPDQRALRWAAAQAFTAWLATDPADWGVPAKRQDPMWVAGRIDELMAVGAGC